MRFAVDRATAGALRRRLLTWYERHRRDLPWRRTRGPYAVWLSEIMLQQTQVATVIPYYRRFIDRFPTIEHLAAADLDEVLHLWAGQGYYARARNLHRAARMIVAELGGRFPRTVEGLRRLPGVGRYSAGAVASVAFDVRAAAVDGNVARVLARLFDLAHDVRGGAGRRAIWDLAETLLPAKRCGDFNQALMELGATVCLPGAAAQCLVCPLRSLCRAFKAGTVSDRPVKVRTTTVRSETHIVAAISRNGRWLFVRRPPEGLWGGLWELPTAVLDGEGLRSAATSLARRQTGAACRPQAQSFCDLRHQLTHRTIRFVGYICQIDGTVPCDMPGDRRRLRNPPIGRRPGRWMKLGDVGSLGLSRAMRKVIAALRHSAG